MNLSNLLITWLKDELPKAKHSESGGKYTCQIIRKRDGRVCFQVEVSEHEMVISCPFTCLTEEISIGSDYMRFGRWCQNVVVQAADPQFFGIIAYYMTWAASVITMGDFSPNWPEPKREELEQATEQQCPVV